MDAVKAALDVAGTTHDLTPDSDDCCLIRRWNLPNVVVFRFLVFDVVMHVIEFATDVAFSLSFYTMPECFDTTPEFERTAAALGIAAWFATGCGLIGLVWQACILLNLWNSMKDENVDRTWLQAVAALAVAATRQLDSKKCVVFCASEETDGCQCLCSSSPRLREVFSFVAADAVEFGTAYAFLKTFGVTDLGVASLFISAFAMARVLGRLVADVLLCCGTACASRTRPIWRCVCCLTCFLIPGLAALFAVTSAYQVPLLWIDVATVRGDFTIVRQPSLGGNITFSYQLDDFRYIPTQWTMTPLFVTELATGQQFPTAMCPAAVVADCVRVTAPHVYLNLHALVSPALSSDIEMSVVSAALFETAWASSNATAAWYDECVTHELDYATSSFDSPFRLMSGGAGCDCDNATGIFLPFDELTPPKYRLDSYLRACMRNSQCDLPVYQETIVFQLCCSAKRDLCVDDILIAYNTQVVITALSQSCDIYEFSP